MKEKLKNFWDDIKTYIAPIFIIVAIGVIVVISICKCVVEVKMQNAQNGGVIVEATIVNVRSYGSSGMIGEFRTRGDKSFETIYNYIDVDGTIYSGTAKAGYNTEKEAKQHIGEKIEIYIDGKGNSIAKGNKTNPTQYIIVAIIFFIIDVAIIAFVIWSKIPYRHKDNNSYEEIIIEYEENKRD
ncbi:MAG: hypothetical protein K2K85_02505 [Clostridia bacterium]|nr:hypothetical protein [Clostridia bacterium]